MVLIKASVADLTLIWIDDVALAESFIPINESKKLPIVAVEIFAEPVTGFTGPFQLFNTGLEEAVASVALVICQLMVTGSFCLTLIGKSLSGNVPSGVVIVN